MSARMWDDQDKARENGMEENNKGRSKSALQDLNGYLNSPTNHLKLHEQEVARLLADVSHEFEQKEVKQEKEKSELCRTLLESERERKRYRNERDDFRKQLQFHEGKKFTNKQEVELRSEVEELKQINEQKEKEWAKRLKESEDTNDAIINEQIRKNEQTTEDLKMRELKIKSLEEMLEKTRFGFTDMNAMKMQLEDKNRLLNETNDKLQRVLSKLNFTEKELDETKSRLSKAVGDKLTDNNPNIADLSDKNRPTKLAEKYAELYDNQWTDAFEEIEMYLGKEENVIRVLLEILMDVMRFCEQRAKSQMEKLQSDLTCSDDQSDDRVPENVRKQLKDLRKVLATAAKDNLYQLYISKLKRSTDENHRLAMKIEPFVKECFEVCWFMAIQDPPIVLCTTGESGDSLDTNLYRPYTSSGKYIEYVVWPAMLLHESGPVLAKGVAQGLKEKKVPHAWVDSKAVSDYLITRDRDSYDYRSVSRTPSEESYLYGQSHADSYTRDNRYLSSGKDRHHQRSMSAGPTRPSYKQSIVPKMVFGTKPNVQNQRPKDKKHPTPEEMRRYFYYVDRRDYLGAQNELGHDIYMKCLFNEHKRSKYC